MLLAAAAHAIARRAGLRLARDAVVDGERVGARVGRGVALDDDVVVLAAGDRHTAAGTVERALRTADLRAVLLGRRDQVLERDAVRAARAAAGGRVGVAQHREVVAGRERLRDLGAAAGVRAGDGARRAVVADRQVERQGAVAPGGGLALDHRVVGTWRERGADLRSGAAAAVVVAADRLVERVLGVVGVEHGRVARIDREHRVERRADGVDRDVGLLGDVELEERVTPPAERRHSPWWSRLPRSARSGRRCPSSVAAPSPLTIT